MDPYLEAAFNAERLMASARDLNNRIVTLDNVRAGAWQTARFIWPPDHAPGRYGQEVFRLLGGIAERNTASMVMSQTLYTVVKEFRERFQGI